MKKFIVLALAAFLVAAFCAQAIAETKITQSGNYRTRFVSRYNTLLLDDPDNKPMQQNMDQRFREYIKFMPNDKITMHAYFEAVSTDWGADVNNVGGAGARNTGGYYVADTDGGLYVRYAYFDVNSDYGMFTVGRQSMNYEGLSMMGFASTVKAFDLPADVFDAERPGDRFKWVYKTGPLSVGFAYDKILETQAVGRAMPAAGQAKDRDSTQYVGFMDYRFANGGVWFDYIYAQSAFNAGNAQRPAGYGVLSTVFNNGSTPHRATSHTFNPAGFMNFGPFRVAAEVKWLTGEAVSSFNDQAIDLRGFGGFLDLNYNFGPGAVALTYVYLSGDDKPFDNKLNQQVTVGADFLPFLLAHVGNQQIFPQRAAGTTVAGTTQGVNNAANHWMLAASGTYNVTEDLALGAAYGWFEINELTPAQSAAGWDKHFGSEFDFRAQYKIMPNLTYYGAVAYFFAGDYAKAGNSNLKTSDAWGTMHNVTLTW